MFFFIFISVGHNLLTVLMILVSSALCVVMYFFDGFRTILSSLNVESKYLSCVISLLVKFLVSFLKSKKLPCVVGQNFGPRVRSFICCLVRVVFDRFKTLGRIFSGCPSGLGSLPEGGSAGCSLVENGSPGFVRLGGR